MICWQQIELADELLYLTEVRAIRHLSCHMSASVSSFERSARFSPLTQLILPFFPPLCPFFPVYLLSVTQ